MELKTTLDTTLIPHASSALRPGLLRPPRPPLQEVPTLSLDETKAALDAEVPECSAVFDATKVELDKVALAAAAAADSGKVDCLIDAFAQPGFCELVTRVYCSVHVSSSLPYTLHTPSKQCNA